MAKSQSNEMEQPVRMLRSLLRVPRDEIDKLQCAKPTVYEMKLISKLCDILHPFEEARDNVQGDRIVTSSMVIACVCGLTYRVWVKLARAN